MLQKIKDLELDIDEKKVRLEKQEDMANMYHQRSREAKTELTKLQQNMVRCLSHSLDILYKLLKSWANCMGV